MTHKAIFLDVDGAVFDGLAALDDPRRISLVPGVGEHLRQLSDQGYLLFVVTNQPGVALGRLREADVEQMRLQVAGLFAEAGVELSDFYFCPHHPEGRVAAYAQKCFCHKPHPGLLFRAAREYNLNLAASWIVGEILNDVEAGRRVDSRTVLIDSGHETEWKLSPLRHPHFSVGDFSEAVGAILRTEQWQVQPLPEERIEQALTAHRSREREPQMSRAVASPSLRAMAARTMARLMAASQ